MKLSFVDGTADVPSDDVSIMLPAESVDMYEVPKKIVCAAKLIVLNLKSLEPRLNVSACVGSISAFTKIVGFELGPVVPDAPKAVCIEGPSTSAFEYCIPVDPDVPLFNNKYPVPPDELY